MPGLLNVAVANHNGWTVSQKPIELLAILQGQDVDSVHTMT